MGPGTASIVRTSLARGRAGASQPGQHQERRQLSGHALRRAPRTDAASAAVVAIRARAAAAATRPRPCTHSPVLGSPDRGAHDPIRQPRYRGALAPPFSPAYGWASLQLAPGQRRTDHTRLDPSTSVVAPFAPTRPCGTTGPGCVIERACVCARLGSVRSARPALEGIACLIGRLKPLPAQLTRRRRGRRAGRRGERGERIACGPEEFQSRVRDSTFRGQLSDRGMSLSPPHDEVRDPRRCLCLARPLL